MRGKQAKEAVRVSCAPFARVWSFAATLVTTPSSPHSFSSTGDGRQPHALAECGVVGEGEGKGKRERALSERPVTSRRGMQ